MGLFDRFTRLSVQVMDTLVSAVARRSIRTTERDTPPEPPRRAPPPPPPAAPPPTPVKRKEPKVEASTGPGPQQAKRAAREARVVGWEPALPGPGPQDRIVVTARDPDTAFVHWSTSIQAEDKRLELRWLAGDRVVRLEEVDPSGKQYLPFVTPDAEYVAVLLLRGENEEEVLRSNTVTPPPSAPRVAGPERTSRPDDPNLAAIAAAQERARATLPRPYGEWWKKGVSS